MPRSRFNDYSLSLVAFWIVVLAVYGSGRATAQVSGGDTVDGLQARISLKQTTLQVGQPLALDISFANVSPDPVLDLSASFQFPEGNDVAVTIQPPAELAYRYAGALDEGAYPAVSLRLETGKPRVVHLVLLYDKTQPSGLVFPTAGTYKLAVDFSFTLRNRPQQNTISLPPATITVQPATGPASEVLKALNSSDLIRALHLGAVPTTAALEHLDSVASQYGQTDLGALALRTVALYRLSGDPSNSEKGIRAMMHYLEGPTPGNDADRMIWHLARASHIAGKYDLAREWMFYLLRQQGSSIYLRPEDPLVHYYLFGPRDFAAQVPWFLLKEPWIIPGSTPPTDLRPRQDAY